jgi:N-acyl-D-aspartate/D-glutamate deacylase
MPEFDLVVRGGTLVDGQGGSPVTADVAVRDGVVAEVGRVRGRGHRELAADGAVVAPGFVDIHTHYDGQATWDARLQPSSWHGVTSVVMGNCGVGFAPVHARDRDRLIDLMEGVEDIPGIALHEGLSWSWTSFPDFLREIDFPHDVDFATQVPHAPLRVHVMGERAAAHSQATPEETAEIARLAKEAVAAGALGFTTSRTLAHKSIDGELTPSYDVGDDELVAIATTIGELGTGVLQLVTDFPDPQAEFALLRRMASAARRPLSVSLMQLPPRPQVHREVLEFLTQANAEGLEVRGQVAARPVGMILGLSNTLNPFMTNPVFQKLIGLSPQEQGAAMREEGLRAEIIAAQTREKNRGRVGGNLIHRYDLMYELGEIPDYEPPASARISERAQRAGISPVELAYDIVASGGMLYLVSANYVDHDLDAAREMLVHPHTVPGLSDGGAHVGTICDASFPTTLLAHWARDRDHDLIPLEFVVQRQCRDTAWAVGLRDRGVLAPGYRADLNVIDLGRVGLARPEVHADLPAGGRRMLQRASGYLHTFVAGQETYAGAQATDALPGRLVRGAQPAPAAS